MLKKIRYILISGVISFVLSSCTVINIENAGLVKTELYPGFVILQVPDTNNNVTIKSRGVGAYLNGEGLSLGYFDDHRVYLNDLSKCLTIFFEAQTDPFQCKK